jgi:predicted CopG family antitoxin
MVSKSISISEEAYNLLKNFQLNGESYSQTLIRLLKRQENLLQLAGVWQNISELDAPLKVLEDTIKQAREAPNRPIKLL